jgi:adenylate cyclase
MQRLRKGLAIGACTGLAGAVLALSSLGDSFERNVGLAWLFRARGPITPPAEVVVVGINARTGADVGLPSLPIQWPRTIHARLIDELVRRKASVIAFDMHFSEPKSAEQDSVFATAIADSDRVVLLEKLIGRRQFIAGGGGKPSAIWMESTEPPLASLAAGSMGIGSFPLPKLGASVYEFWSFKASAGDAPTLPAVALQLHAARVHPQWLESLARSGTTTLGDLIPATGPHGRAGALRDLMRSLRTTLESDGAIGERITRGLENDDPLKSEPGLPDVLRALVELYQGPNVRYLNFYGPPGTITTIPYQAVINAGDNVPDLSGKVVFVGYSDLDDAGQPDRFYTVFTRDDGVDLSGVEIAATSFANLLTDRALKPLDALPTAALLTAFGLVMGALVYLLPALWGVPLALTLAGIYAFTAQHGFAARDLWLPFATPLLAQTPAALFAGLLGQYLLERRRGQRVSEAISYYLPENIARDLAKNTLDPATVNKVVFSVCLATDMAGFSSIAEKLPPGELAAFLNEYFDGLSRPLREHGVDVTEFRADGIMCAWTSPAPVLGARRGAVLAALGAAAAITEFKERHPVLSSPLRIGLEVGWVYVGHAGGGGHFVYSIVGDCANTASRIESLNKHIGSQILASQDTVEGLEEILVRPLGRFQLMGKSESVPVVEIVAVRARATDRDLLLCERFGEALARFQCADWATAHALLDRILNDHPEDGPARFYRARCLRYLEASAATPEDPGLILMTDK